MKLLKKAGIEQLDMDGKFVAIKMHFGELGNLSFLRPNYARAVADLVKSLGGKPFLTDCNTMYPGSRKNALEPYGMCMAEWFYTADGRMSDHYCGWVLKARMILMYL